MATETANQSVEQKLDSKLGPSAEELKSAVASESKLTQESKDAKEYSATTIARMMGIATLSDLGVLEGKIDLAMAKMNLITTKLEKVMTVLNGTPSGSDLERIDVQIGSLKAMIRDALSGTVTKAEEVQSISKEALLNAVNKKAE